MPQSKRPSRNLPIVTELHLLMLRSDLNLPLLSANVSNTGFSSNQNLEYEFRTKPLCRGSGGEGRDLVLFILDVYEFIRGLT